MHSIGTWEETVQLCATQKKMSLEKGQNRVIK